MRHMIPVILFLGGLASVIGGASALAQDGYVCSYNCLKVCGDFTCYPGNFVCAENGQIRRYFTGDSKLLGGCVLGGTTCSVTAYVCQSRAFLSTNPTCIPPCCTISSYSYERCACN